MTPEYRREYYLKNKEKLKEQQKNYYHKNYLRRKERNRDFRLKRQFGLELGQYKVLLEAQKYTCLICERHQSLFPKGLAVDHCHSTGKVRGLLCLHCNTALGQVKDNPVILEKMIKYIKDHQN